MKIKNFKLPFYARIFIFILIGGVIVGHAEASNRTNITNWPMEGPNETYLPSTYANPNATYSVPPVNISNNISGNDEMNETPDNTGPDNTEIRPGLPGKSGPAERNISPNKTMPIVGNIPNGTAAQKSPGFELITIIIIISIIYILNKKYI